LKILHNFSQLPLVCALEQLNDEHELQISSDAAKVFAARRQDCKLNEKAEYFAKNQ
jgi:hypothetical protein